MKSLLALFLAAGLFAQTPAPPPPPPAKTPQTAPPGVAQLATRVTQLMESTAVAVPDLVRASDSIRQLAASTAGSIARAPQNSALLYQLMNQVRAYLSLSDSFPRPNPFPPTADQQFIELREDLQRIQHEFESTLQNQSQAVQARNSDPNNLKRYAEANTKILAPGAASRVVFMGDSITDLWRLNEYFTGRDFINRGISGQTTTQMLGRFMQDVILLHPKAVLILAGTNDLSRGIAPYAIEDNLEMMGDVAKAHGIKPLFASILPVSDYHKSADARYEMTKTRPPAAIQQVNRWMQDYCRREGFIYVDYYSALADPQGMMPADAADDGLHPNAKGYRVMSPVALSAIDRALSGHASAAENAQQRRRSGVLPK
ncbi:MAG TPA: SGNH/GDSL hydrolase family protein [Bryobacteraceae bacterium]|nr:SGNH/GDSL hydrolase family protein [Bryobacteraceae bacterium]